MKYIVTIFLLSGMIFAQSLNSLIDYALKNSMVIKQSEAQMQLSAAQREESHAAQFGSIDLVGSYTHYNLPRTLAPLTPAIMKDPVTASQVATTKDLFGTGIMYTVPLFTGFAQTRQIEMDSIVTQLSQSKFSLTQEQLVYNVASLYLSVLALQDMSKAQQKHVEALRKLTDIIKKEVTLGKKAQIDLMKAQSDLYGNISYLEVIKGNIAMTKASLASLVGLEHVGEIRPVKVSVKKPQYSINNLLSRAASLDKVHISELNIKKANKGIEKSKAGLYPQVSLNSYYGYNYGENDPSNLHAGDWANEKNWQISVNAKWTVFDFGKNSASTQKAKIAKMQATFEKQQTLLDLRKSLVEAYEKMKQEYANYHGNLKQYALAKQSEKVERVRYENGVSTINDLLYASSQTQLSRAKLIESTYNYQKGKFYMDYLLEKGVRR